MIMGTTIERRQASFRLSTDLLERMQAEARKENRSLNNFVEHILMSVIYKLPNPDTMAAIEEVRSGKYAGTIDMTNFDSFMKSVNEIE